MTERPGRGARGFDDDETERPSRGRPPRVLRADELDGDDDVAWDAAPRGRTDARTDALRAASSADGAFARVVEVARAEVRVLVDGAVRAAVVTPRVQASGGLVVGDEVTLDTAGRVSARAERRTLLQRRGPANERRPHTLAANVDVGLVVLAPHEDGLGLGYLERAYALFDPAGIEVAVALAQSDLLGADELGALLAELDPWLEAGIEVHPVALGTGEGLDDLRSALGGRVVMVVCESGVDGAALVDALDPTAQPATGAVGASAEGGSHATAPCRLVPFLEGGALVDGPSARRLVPEGLDADEIASAFPEFSPYIGACQFRDCAHLGEAGCAIESASFDEPGVAAALVRYRKHVDGTHTAE